MIDLNIIRQIAAGLPGVEEGTWYGAPAFRVAGKVFVRVDVNDDDLVLMRVGSLYRDALVAQDGTRFSLTDHPPEREGAVLMRLSRTRTRDVGEVRELVVEAWQRAAPRALRAGFDGVEGRSSTRSKSKQAKARGNGRNRA